MHLFSVHPALLLAAYCTLVLLASLMGGLLPMMFHLTHRRLQIAISFVAGLMLGMALLHLIPHATYQMHSLDRTVAWALAGFLVMFFMQRFLHYHHHDLPDETEEQALSTHPEHDHDHADHADPPTLTGGPPLSWVGAALGLTLHSLIDGLALAASVEAETRGHSGLAGFGIALVVILHKPFDALAVTTLMAAGGSSRPQRHVLNAAFSLATPLGVALFYFGAGHFADANQVFLGCALAFCAGTFLCIACSDLLPELQFHSHDRFKLSIALLAGLAVSILIGRFESTGHDRHAGEGAAAGAIQAPQGPQNQ